MRSGSKYAKSRKNYPNLRRNRLWKLAVKFTIAKKRKSELIQTLVEEV